MRSSTPATRTLENGSSTTQRWRLRPGQGGRERAADQTERRPQRFAEFPIETAKPRRAMAAQRCWVAADAPAGNGTTSSRRASAAASDADELELPVLWSAWRDDGGACSRRVDAWPAAIESSSSRALGPRVRACERSPPWTRPAANTPPTTPRSIVPIGQSRFSILSLVANTARVLYASGRHSVGCFELNQDVSGLLRNLHDPVSVTDSHANIQYSLTPAT